MPTVIDVDGSEQYLIMRNCIVDNLVNAQNFGDGRTRYLQFNWWGAVVPDFQKILGDIIYIPAMPRACDEEISNPVVNQFPSSVRIGTMKNRRNILGGGYNSNF